MVKNQIHRRADIINAYKLMMTVANCKSQPSVES